MQRNATILGKDRLDLSVQGTVSTALTAEIQINFRTVGRLIGHYAQGAYRFYDVNEFIPDYKPPLPDFENGINIDYLQFCNLKVNYIRDNNTISSLTFDCLKGAGQRSVANNNGFMQLYPAKWLTNQPSGKKIGMSSTEWLSIPINFVNSITNMRLQITGTMADGTIQTKTLPQISQVQNGTVYTFDVSPNIALAGYAIKPVQYSVQLVTSQGVAITEAFRYTIHDLFDPITFVYVNSFGVWDTLTAVADISTSIKTKPNRLEHQHDVKRYDTPYFRQLSIVFLQLSEEEKQALTEMLISKDIYSVETHNFISVECLTEDVTFHDTANYSEELTLEFRYSNNERNF